MSYKILIIDDESTICSALKLSLEIAGYKVNIDFSAKEGLSRLRTFLPDVVVLDLRLPDMDGLAVLSEIKEFDESIIVIMITAFGETKTAVEAVKRGAVDYLVKPFDTNELEISIKRALKERSLKHENEILRQRSEKSEFITKDPSMLDILARLDSIARVDSSVLIIGETGTGKELIAGLIHKKSSRASEPFITLNCSAIPSNLFESELFGHEKNAFTGASARKKGLLELADKGTFFLDEIGELPPDLQAKLLRFLEDRSIRRVGGLVNIPLDVRIIAATNKNLKEEIEKNNFRSDLYYRLNVVQVKIPPLRERPDDIPLLLDYYRRVYNRHFNKNICGFSEKALKLLTNYSWPGNVRELKNIVERAFILARGLRITERELPQELTKGKYITPQIPDEIERFIPLEELEKQYIATALDATHWNISKAAELLGISRFALQRRIKKYFEKSL
ncbi:MAG: two-component system, NtrC family, response regulator AtoC [Thermoanaerobacteraceae bacterium]|jgi:two-component system response regulator AtoC|uniref:Stage 0 sporulation protein A homolog n=1 Tax=Biomaibacter acetigenes TaxID=2316383 RepID=A0A3G2RAY6_9FIRM|nr:sigma-54 dependent transcriptional regulator [Biomaibacter acetigenes]AYO31897.1 response regulator [Biomaibacter acetigenes]MDK2878643.1 two-component system, NtrC family, response regulator AtoC [Thermoanaerobacteraceae bacterium]RKL62431.1 sigma-54-dependent Fis family transcriptional regulator [Thermoanaerobacteraceae bacterium SP2]